MKIRGFHSLHLVKFIHHLSYGGLFYGLFLMFQGDLHWLPFLVFTFLISNIGESAGLHRYFSHNSFKTGPIRHKLLCLLATLTTQGSILHWTAMHRLHHKHSDTKQDPVDPQTIGFWRSFFGIVDPEQFKKINSKIIIDKLRDKDVVWFHNWYWGVIITFVISLMIIDPLLIISCYLMPVGIVRLNFGLNNTINHGYFTNIGYRNYKSNDNSVNSILFHFVTLFSGESLHNNHHYNSKKFSFQDRWWEIDPTGLFIKYFLID